MFSFSFRNKDVKGPPLLAMMAPLSLQAWWPFDIRIFTDMLLEKSSKKA